MPTYSYGGFPLHDGVHYFLLEKTFDLVPLKQTTFKLARFEGVKVTGVQTDARTLQVLVYVLGTSRTDLEARLDALFAAMALRQQQLTLHALDGRYAVADCISARAPLRRGTVLSAVATLQFLCQQPYLYAPSASTFSSASAALPNTGPSTWQTAALAVPSSGTVFARPTVVLTNTTSMAAAVHLTSALVSGTAYTTLAVEALPAARPSGWTFVLDDTAGHIQRVVLSAAAAAGATSLSVTSFSANWSYPATTTQVYDDTYITAVTLTSNPDGTSLTASGLGTLFGTGTALTLHGDPTSASGYTVVSSAAPTANQPFAGLFPLIEPSSTTLQVTATCTNQPSLALSATWTPRWLA